MKHIKQALRSTGEWTLLIIMMVVFFIAYAFSPKVRRNVNNDFDQ